MLKSLLKLTSNTKMDFTLSMIQLVIWLTTGGRIMCMPTVRVSSGELRGSVSYDTDAGYEYYSYLGVPYAKVEHRFQAAKPITPWENIFEAIDGKIKCPQTKFINLTFSLIGTEDCLIQNIYTRVKPKDVDSKLLPVMVFIHGGAFRTGSASPSVYGPQYFLRHNVVLVAMNYRLDILGFLCLGITEAPGNMGLKDQVEALKWIKKNIIAFGGDPDNITIFGTSAGSASVMYHLLSPMSKGLFNRAIMQSGSAISPWAFQFEPLKVASKLVKQMGRDTEDPQELVRTLMNKTVEELFKISSLGPMGLLSPCKEKEILNTDSFLSDTPYNIVSKSLYSKVPMIIGYNSNEGYLFVGKAAKVNNFNTLLPKDLKFPSEEIAKETAQNLQQLYIGNEKINKNNSVKFVGESTITYPVTTTIDLFLKTTEELVFIYKFSYDGELNMPKKQTEFWNSPGASHGDELFYMFKQKFTPTHGLNETNIINKITTMWTNFGKFGNPTPEETSLLPVKWQPANKEDPRLFVIDSIISTESLWDSETLRILEDIYSKYRRMDE